MRGWRTDIHGNEIIWGPHVIWANPEALGHAFIGLRKARAEDRIIERMEARWAAQMVLAAITGGSRLG